MIRIKGNQVARFDKEKSNEVSENLRSIVSEKVTCDNYEAMVKRYWLQVE